MSKVLVEVGVGRSPKEGYIHCDIFPHPKVKYLCNAWAIPFNEGSVDEIYSRHMLEHLTFKQAERTLKHWFCVLKQGGKLDISVPDFESHLKQYFQEGNSKHLSKKVSNREHAMAGFYGWQDNEYDVHKWGWTFLTLSDILSEIGYENITRIQDETELGELNLRINAEKKDVKPKSKRDSDSLYPKIYYFNWRYIINKAVVYVKNKINPIKTK